MPLPRGKPSLGFTRGKASTCCYQHTARDLRCIVHGDDFVLVGAEHELRWVQGRMEESFLVKVIGQLGGDHSDLKELRVLNRVLRWIADGILLEADPRHQEILVAAEPGNALLTPGAKEQPIGELAETQLNAEATTWFRSDAARCNYLGLDRPDTQGAVPQNVRTGQGQPARAAAPGALRQGQPTPGIQLPVAA